MSDPVVRGHGAQGRGEGKLTTTWFFELLSADCSPVVRNRPEWALRRDCVLENEDSPRVSGKWRLDREELDPRAKLIFDLALNAWKQMPYRQKRQIMAGVRNAHIIAVAVIEAECQGTISPEHRARLKAGIWAGRVLKAIGHPVEIVRVETVPAPRGTIH